MGRLRIPVGITCFVLICKLSLQGLIVFLGRFDDTLPRRRLGAEGGHVGAVLTTQDEDIGVAFVHVVVPWKSEVPAHRGLRDSLSSKIPGSLVCNKVAGCTTG